MAQQYGTAAGLSVNMAGPFGSVKSTIKLTEVTLPADGWKGAESPYSQVVLVDGVSVNSMVNLYPSVEQTEEFHDMDIVFTTENDGGVVTVYAIGDKPVKDYIIQASIMEVTA